jgi:hypothetical protein
MSAARHLMRTGDRFPLTVPGAHALSDLPEAPEPPIPLEANERAAWDRMPLSKRRLATLGALEAGTDAARSTAIIIAAECRAQGMPFAVAEKVASAVAFTTASTPRHRVLRQLPNAAAWAYEPTNGEPILTGCCRAPGAGETSGLQSPSRLRSLMAPYCDSACAASCPMLKAIRQPREAIAETEYAPVAASSLFQAGGGLGEAGRLAYQFLALAASLNPERQIAMSANYLVHKSGGQFSRQAFSKALRALNDVGLATVIGRDETRTYVRIVPVLDQVAIDVLERKLGVSRKRQFNINDARRDTKRHADWLLSLLADDTAWA